MAQSARQTLDQEVPAHTRRDDIIRPPDLRREFPVREAQRHLRAKEKRWAPIAYAVFLVAIGLIFSTAYTTYAFSKYRDLILPGVYVDVLPVGGMTTKQATNAVLNQIDAMDHRPLDLTYGAYPPWHDKYADMGLTPEVDPTVREASRVGRDGGFWQELLDRLPIHPSHTIPLIWNVNQQQLTTYLRTIIFSKVQKQKSDANLYAGSDNHIWLVHSQRGLRLDIPKSEQAIQDALGHLTRQRVQLRVDHLEPTITDEAALRVRDKVENFLSRPPILRLGTARIVTSRADFAPMMSFRQVIGKNRATIEMNIDSTKLRAFVGKVASSVDRAAQNPKLDFTDGQVRVISPRVVGRHVDQDSVYTKLAAVLVGLKPNVKLAFTVSNVQPPVDMQNPASLGINTLLASASTSFVGAGPGRLADVTEIAKTLDGDLLPPNQEISFNYLVGNSWDPRVYQDDETEANGQLVPSEGGGMQQVATTFLRAFFAAGLTVKEHHPHGHRFKWYEPPVGLDAVVAPDRGWDLVFVNNTGKHLLIKTRVEPVRQEVYIYVYGPKLGWSVAVDKIGKITKIFPHGPKIIRDDPTLPRGETRHLQWAHNGARVVVQRTITYPNGKVSTDEIDSTYRPWQGIVLVGSQVPDTPTPLPTKTPVPSPTPNAPTPVPSDTPTE